MKSRTARVRALAKINLGLKVLYRRDDSYHELRTVFQTVGLADTLDIAFTPARRTSIEVASSIVIEDNLVEKAARLALERLGVHGEVAIQLDKRIPMGAGLGGGSSDAAAVLLALPVLCGRGFEMPVLIETAAELGSDVPFFLLGGAAVALGRGTELYPLADLPRAWALLVVPELHVSTPEAYRALGRAQLTSSGAQNIINSFQSWVWDLAGNVGREPAGASGENDFESAVFREHSRLGHLKRQIERAGGVPAMLSGSGAALYGLFASRERAAKARAAISAVRSFVVPLVSRSRYRAQWFRALDFHSEGKVWPPQSRYA